MIKTSILSDKLRSFEYYKSKLPLYLQADVNFVEHFRIWYELLTKNESVVDETTTQGESIAKTIDLLFELLNIFDLHCSVEEDESPMQKNKHYLELLNRIDGSEDGTKSDILDKIGDVFGLKRDLSVSVNQVEYYLTLNNTDFLTLIKCTIIKNYFDGSYKELSDYYTSVGLPVFLLTTGSAQCTLQLINIAGSDYEFSDDVQKLFEAGELTVKSAGISYVYSILTNTTAAVFDAENRGFDVGVFVI